MNGTDHGEEPHMLVRLPRRVVERFAAEGERGTGQIPWGDHWEIIFACRDAVAEEGDSAGPGPR